MRKKLALCLGVALCAALSAQGAVIIYTNQTAFETAAGALTVEDLADATLVPGVTSIVSTAPEFQLPYAGSSAFTGFSVMHDRPSLTAYSTFTFSSPITAVGALWDLAGPGGQGMGLQVLLDGNAVGSEIARSTAGTFWGVISDTPFTVLRLNAGTQTGSGETFEMRNLEFGGNAGGEVPEPASLSLVAAGLAGLAVWRRRRG